MKPRTVWIIAVVGSLALGALMALGLHFAVVGTPQAVIRATLGRSPVFDIADGVAEARDGRNVGTRINQGSPFAGASPGMTRTYVMEGSQASVLNEFSGALERFGSVYVIEDAVNARDGEDFLSVHVTVTPPEGVGGVGLEPGEVFVRVTAADHS